jgi:hypothetical protein
VTAAAETSRHDLVNDPRVMLAAAQDLAAQGLHVIPLHNPMFTPAGTLSHCDCNRPACRPGGKDEKSIGKHPRVDRWGERATRDEAQITEWWGETFPGANIGIVAGYPVPGGGELAVLDVDPRNGGDETYRALAEAHGAPPPTATDRLGDGAHMYFRSPVPMPCGKLGPGIDFLAGAPRRGQVVAPPSLHPSGLRRGWALSPEGGDAIAELPAAWRDVLLRGKPRAAASHDAGPRGAGAPILDGEGGARGAGRKSTLESAGRAMWAREHSPAEIEAALRTMNGRCVPPLDERDLSRVIEHVFRVEPGRSPGYEPRARLRVVDPPPPADAPPVILSAAEQARRLGAQGAHLATGYNSLDEHTRGGPRVGDVEIVGGAPGSCKTTFVCNRALNYARAGYHVAVLASDESASGLLIRWGQDYGISRDALERGEKDATEELAGHLEHELPTLHILDASDGHTVESVVEYLLARANGAAAVLIVDSVQTVASLGTAEADSPRERVDAVVKALKRAAAAGLLVIATCELNRGAYRSRNADERVEDLASFKESGGVEYGASLALVLRNVPDSGELIDATFAKNRLGTRGAFRLSLDRTHARLSEVGRPAEPSAEDKRADNERVKRDGMRAKVLAVVGKHPGLKSKAAMIAAIGPVNRNRAFDAIESLLIDGSLVVGADKVFRVAPSREPGEDDE